MTLSPHNLGRLKLLADLTRCVVKVNLDRAGNHVVTLRGTGWERQYADRDLSEAIRFASERETLR